MFKPFSYVLLLFTIVIVSCSTKQNQVDYAQLTKDYYEAMNESNFEKLSTMYYDSVRVGEGGYYMVYAIQDYQDWLSWDAVFQPQYKILNMEVFDSKVEIEASKSCKRILFLNGEPSITKERLTFKEGKIYSSEIVEYIVFHTEQWEAKRDTVVQWVAKNHPELNGFIFDQSRQGGLNYLQVMELYEKKELR